MISAIMHLTQTILRPRTLNLWLLTKWQNPHRSSIRNCRVLMRELQVVMSILTSKTVLYSTLLALLVLEPLVLPLLMSTILCIRPWCQTQTTCTTLSYTQQSRLHLLSTTNVVPTVMESLPKSVSQSKTTFVWLSYLQQSTKHPAKIKRAVRITIFLSMMKSTRLESASIWSLCGYWQGVRSYTREW